MGVWERNTGVYVQQPSRFTDVFMRGSKLTDIILAQCFRIETIIFLPIRTSMSFRVGGGGSCVFSGSVWVPPRPNKICGHMPSVRIKRNYRVACFDMLQTVFNDANTCTRHNYYCAGVGTWYARELVKT